MSSFINWNTWPHAVQMNQMLWLNHLYYFSLHEKKRNFGPDSLFCSHSSQQLWLWEKAWMEQSDWEGLPPHPSRHSMHLWKGEGDVTGRVLFGLQITLPLTRCLFSLLVNQPITHCFRRTVRDQGSSGRTEMTLWSRQDQLLAGVSSGL